MIIDRLFLFADGSSRLIRMQIGFIFLSMMDTKNTQSNTHLHQSIFDFGCANETLVVLCLGGNTASMSFGHLINGLGIPETRAMNVLRDVTWLFKNMYMYKYSITSQDCETGQLLIYLSLIFQTTFTRLCEYDHTRHKSIIKTLHICTHT